MEGNLHASLADTLQRDWTFAPSQLSLTARLSRLKSELVGWKRFPHFEILRVGGEGEQRWAGYFAYCPSGILEDHHRDTLKRLRAQAGALGVVIASPELPGPTDPALDVADLLIRKELGGFDFSAYAILIDTIARLAPHADLLLMNDSVLGPFNNCAAAWKSRWRLTGFTASSQFENHLQSYAFILRDVTHETLGALAPSVRLDRACDSYRDAVNLQETRLGRIASHSMTVGSLFFDKNGGNPVLRHALQLCENGFPFLKRSLIGRYASMQDESAVRAFLKGQGI